MDSMQNKKIKITKTTKGNKVSDLKILTRAFSSSSVMLKAKPIKKNLKKTLEITPIPVNSHHKNIVSKVSKLLPKYPYN